MRRLWRTGRRWRRRSRTDLYVYNQHQHDTVHAVCRVLMLKGIPAPGTCTRKSDRVAGAWRKAGVCGTVFKHGHMQHSRMTCICLQSVDITLQVAECIWTQSVAALGNRLYRPLPVWGTCAAYR